MNANNHAFILPHRPEWFRQSGVTDCQTCEGRGYFEKRPWLHVSDPDNWAVDCADCAGVGHFACQTCGFSTPITGYDCFVCDEVCSLSADALRDIDPAELAAAFVKSVAAARAD